MTGIKILIKEDDSIIQRLQQKSTRWKQRRQKKKVNSVGTRYCVSTSGQGELTENVHCMRIQRNPHSELKGREKESRSPQITNQEGLVLSANSKDNRNVSVQPKGKFDSRQLVPTKPPGKH